jgi:hypothetical protein
MRPRENTQTGVAKLDIPSVSGSEWMQKARELRAFSGIQAKFPGETGLDGCGCSLQRTRLCAEIP